jgi:hypothetical protein
LWFSKSGTLSPFSVLHFRFLVRRISRGFGASMWLAFVVTLPVGAAQLTLTWDDNSTNETGFKIERAAGSGTFAQIATVRANVTTYVDDAVTDGATYRYRVRAYNKAGHSAYSNVVSKVAEAVNTAPIIGRISNRTITSDGSKTAISFTLGDSTNDASSLAVVASSSNPAVIPRGNVVLSGSGSTRTLTLSAAAGVSGQSVITLAVHDGELVSYRDFAVTVSGGNAATASAPLPTGHLSRVTVKALAGDREDTLLVKFTTSGASKSMLVRAIGPTLSTLGATGVLADPRLALMRDTNLVGLNDDWGGLKTLSTTFSRVGAFPLPLLSRDAAIQPVLTPGTYSLLVSGPIGDAAGQVLAELYDADTATQPVGRLKDASARTRVSGTSRTLVLGFTVGGQDSVSVLIRGVGNSLAAAGATGVVERPRIEIHRGKALVRRVDGWTPTVQLLEAQSRVGARPLTHLADGAALLSLSPGSYTATVSGIDGSAGFGQVEIYEVR